MKDFRLYVSEVAEEGERISASRILCEIHDAMCMCGVGPDECDTEGIQRTVLEAAQGLLANGKWSTSFEDGWIKVETIEPPVRAELRKSDGWVSTKADMPGYGKPVHLVVHGVVQFTAYARDIGEWRPCVGDSDSMPEKLASHWRCVPAPPIPSAKTEEA